MTTQVCGDFRPSLLEAIRSAWSGRDRAKRLAREINRSHRSAENWMQGRSAPGIDELLEMMAASAVVENAVVRLVASRRLERQHEKEATAEYADALRRRDALVCAKARRSPGASVASATLVHPSGSARLLTVERRLSPRGVAS